MTQDRCAYCETCGNLFIAERAGIVMTVECPNCGRDADVISRDEYQKLLKQKSQI